MKSSIFTFSLLLSAPMITISMEKQVVQQGEAAAGQIVQSVASSALKDAETLMQNKQLQQTIEQKIETALKNEVTKLEAALMSKKASTTTSKAATTTKKATQPTHTTSATQSGSTAMDHTYHTALIALKQRKQAAREAEFCFKIISTVITAGGASGIIMQPSNALINQSQECLMAYLVQLNKNIQPTATPQTTTTQATSTSTSTSTTTSTTAQSTSTAKQAKK